jgi:hypothetical protein
VVFSSSQGRTQRDLLSPYLQHIVHAFSRGRESQQRRLHALRPLSSRDNRLSSINSQTAFHSTTGDCRDRGGSWSCPDDQGHRQTRAGAESSDYRIARVAQATKQVARRLRVVSSHARHPRPATSDKTQGSQALTRPTASKRVSSPPVGTFSSASDVTDTEIETASLEAVASAGACTDSRRSSGMATRRGHEMRYPRVVSNAARLASFG